jgi:3-oxoacyl-[acyl-carrier-protein] synthase II
VLSRRSRRQPGAVTEALDAMWSEIAPRLRNAGVAVVSGATGAAPATAEERAFLARHATVPVRATGTHLGHGLEPQFVMNVALAAMAVERKALFPTTDDSGVEIGMTGPLSQAVVTSVGHWRGEGMGLVEAID